MGVAAPGGGQSTRASCQEATEGRGCGCGAAEARQYHDLMLGCGCLLAPGAADRASGHRCIGLQHLYRLPGCTYAPGSAPWQAAAQLAPGQQKPPQVRGSATRHQGMDAQGAYLRGRRQPGQQTRLRGPAAAPWPAPPAAHVSAPAAAAAVAAAAMATARVGWRQHAAERGGVAASSVSVSFSASARGSGGGSMRGGGMGGSGDSQRSAAAVQKVVG